MMPNTFSRKCRDNITNKVHNCAPAICPVFSRSLVRRRSGSTVRRRRHTRRASAARSPATASAPACRRTAPWPSPSRTTRTRVSVLCSGSCLPSRYLALRLLSHLYANTEVVGFSLWSLLGCSRRSVGAFGHCFLAWPPLSNYV